MAQFDFYLNRQGVRGPQGIQGVQGFSPIITVATNTLSEYVLQIQTQNNTFLTANLREHKDDLGGTYIRYNRETGVMFAGDADVASQSQMGVVRFATATDIEREDDSSVVSPADVADMIEAIDPSGDISDLQNRVTTLEGKTESLEGSVSDNSLAISELQSNVSGLLANYVPKTRTINGYALSSNITLTANDVNAYSKSEADTLLAAKADVSDLPDMNNYYNTTQIDLMLNEKADISDIPTVGNGTITINQGGVQRGQFSVNQSGDVTINLTDGGGGGGGSYIEGNGIDITNDVISVVPDGTTIDFNASGELKVISAPTPNNMVTTDTTQTISGTKSFSNGVKATFVDDLDGGVIVSSLSGTMQVGNGTLNSLSLYTGGSSITVNRAGSNYVNVDSGNIGSYALTSLPVATTSVLGGVIPDGTTITVDADGTIHGASTYVLPTASTSTLGGVKVDGTTITIDANGVISGSGGGGSSAVIYESGKGISIDAKVIYAYDASGLGIIGFTKEYDTDNREAEVSEIIPVVYKLDNGQFIQYATNCPVEHEDFHFDWEITINNETYSFERSSEYDYTPTNTYIISNTGLINNTASGTTKAITDKAIDSGVSSAVIVGGGDNTNVGNSSVAIGYDTFDGYGQAVCVGYNAHNACTGGIAIGYKSNVTYNCQSNGIAIGQQAKVDANGAIQLSSGTNATANTLQVGSYTLLNTSTGKIPSDRLQVASTSALGGVKVDGTTITIDNNGVISSAGGGGSSYTAGTGIDITNDVISIDNTVATKDDLDSKQDSFDTVAPLNLVQAIDIGKAYLANTEDEFTGTTFSEQLSLLKSGDISTGQISGLDTTKAWSLEVKNIEIKSMPSQNTVILAGRLSNGIAQISFRTDGRIYGFCNFGNTSLNQEMFIPTIGQRYDFRIEYDGSGTVRLKGKLSSNSGYASYPYSYTISSTPSDTYITVGCTDTVINIADVTVTNDGTTLFSNVPSTMSLSIGTGLAVQNGSLVNTVDISNKVTGTGITNMIKLTQAQYDALATKDANTFYVIVTASS